MTAVLFFLEVLFCLKIGWNLLIPYELAWRTLKANAYLNKGISIAPWFEFILLALAVAWAFIAGGAPSFQSPKRIAMWGVAMIIASYVHFFVGGALAGWIVSLIMRRRGSR
jgi:hypothetical protein